MNTRVDYILIGYNSESTANIQYDSVEKWFKTESISNDLKQIDIPSILTLLSLQIASNETVNSYIGKGPVNEDLYPLLEYQAPQSVLS